MKQVLIIQNIEREGPAMIGDILQKLRIPHEIFMAFDSIVYPDPAKYAAVIVLGGPDSANDETEKMSGQILFAKKCIGLRIPYLGVCLGHQVLLKAAGGAVHKNMHGGKQVKEIGFSDGHEPYTVSLTGEGMQDVLFNGINEVFPVFQLHGEAADIPNDAVLLGEGIFCKNQVARVGTVAYGFQCHIEQTESSLAVLLEEDPDLKTKDSALVMEEFNAIKFEYEKNCAIIIENFLKIAELR